MTDGEKSLEGLKTKLKFLRGTPLMEDLEYYIESYYKGDLDLAEGSQRDFILCFYKLTKEIKTKLPPIARYSVKEEMGSLKRIIKGIMDYKINKDRDKRTFSLEDRKEKIKWIDGNYKGHLRRLATEGIVDETRLVKYFESLCIYLKSETAIQHIFRMYMKLRKEVLAPF